MTNIFDNDFISNSSEDEPKNEQQDINSELEKREPLDALFFFVVVITRRFLKIITLMRNIQIWLDIKNYQTDGVKQYKNGLSEIINNFKPYVQKVNEKERLQM